jgi:hypothetical protein
MFAAERAARRGVEMSISGIERGRVRTRTGSAGTTSGYIRVTGFFALLLVAALASVVARAPAKVAATVLAARVQGGW